MAKLDNCVTYAYANIRFVTVLQRDKKGQITLYFVSFISSLLKYKNVEKNIRGACVWQGRNKKGKKIPIHFNIKPNRFEDLKIA